MLSSTSPATSEITGSSRTTSHISPSNLSCFDQITVSSVA